MLLTITTTHQPATDLGFLLHKNPSRLHRIELAFGDAYIAYPEATNERCTAALINSCACPPPGGCPGVTFRRVGGSRSRG